MTPVRKLISIISLILVICVAGLVLYLRTRPTDQEPAGEPPAIEIPVSAGAVEGNGSIPAPPAPELTWLIDLVIPPYRGKAYEPINGNMPMFDTDNIAPVSYEIYYQLDELGRCTLADAVVGQDIMASGKRGSIGSVKPTGWHTDRYSFVDGEALYNRCHLIAHYLTGEDANPRNLVTGTRYMNTEGMNALENMVGDYVRETGYHVRYRVTPVWTGDNLVCDGLLVEAWSVEDEGEDICFCIFAYNVQPGVIIDYSDGDNAPEDPSSSAAVTEQAPEYAKYLLDEDVTGTYILNIKKKKFHRPDCKGAADLAEDNREEYTGSRNELVENGYVPCGECKP